MADILVDQQVVVRERFEQCLQNLKQDGYKQTHVANKLGITQGAVSLFKNGVTPISFGLIVDLCKAFNLELSDFVDKGVLQTQSSRAYAARSFYLCRLFTPDKSRTPINGTLKYGITDNPNGRIYEINQTKLSFHHEYMAVFTFDKPAVAAAVEGKFKRKDNSLTGEYIDLSIQEAIALTEEAIDGLGASPTTKREGTAFKILN